MVWEKNCPVVVMLENFDNKVSRTMCDVKYWRRFRILRYSSERVVSNSGLTFGIAIIRFHGYSETVVGWITSESARVVWKRTRK